MYPSENLFLVGPMGAGKTTLGRRLAQSRSLSFFDSDQEIELRTGVDIPYIFEKEGEAGFRKRERCVLDDLTQAKGVVLATGGGAILDEGNRQNLMQRGTVIYLRASLALQLSRTAKSKKRPLLNRAKDRRALLRDLFEVRDPLYRAAADIVIETDGRNARGLVREIDRQLKLLERQQDLAGDSTSQADGTHNA